MCFQSKLQRINVPHGVPNFAHLGLMGVLTLGALCLCCQPRFQHETEQQHKNRKLLLARIAAQITKNRQVRNTSVRDSGAVEQPTVGFDSYDMRRPHLFTTFGTDCGQFRLAALFRFAATRVRRHFQETHSTVASFALTYDDLIMAPEDIILKNVITTPRLTPKKTDTNSPENIGMAAKDDFSEANSDEEQ